MKHLVKIEQTPAKTRWWAICSCGYKSGQRNSQEAAAATAENHLKGLAG